MSGPVRAVCVTRSVALRRALRRSLHAAGAEVEFVDEVGAIANAPTLVVIDRPTHDGMTPAERAALASGRAMLVVGVSLADDGTVDGLRAEGCNHVITGEDEPDDAELVVTSGKLSSGDIFGLEKYLAWGVRVTELEVANYEEKRAALLAVTASAREAGARRPMVARVESVVDELLMNAMYDAPAAALGDAPQLPTDLLARVAAPARLRWASDGRHFAVSVEDRFGALVKGAIVDHLQRARAERGRPRGSSEAAGAGLGLYFIVSSVTRFIANVEPGARTEVIGLFDLRQAGRDAESCARSLHVFATAS
ncbi:MAG: hypothetical protein IPL61_33555 [Myxococcales bacterium]|nr:hypothetical protein [Myxococcales bacterium]